MEVEGLKLSRTLWGPPGHRSVSVCPISYLKEKGFQLPRPSTSSKGHIQTVANRGREGRQEETLLQQGAWCWSLLGWWASSLCVPWSSSGGTRAPSTQTEEVTAGWAQASRPTLIGKADDWDGWNTALLSHNQPVRGKFRTLQPLPQILPIKTRILSCKKQIASLCLMQDTRCLGLVHWDEPERWYGVGGGRGVQDRELMYTRGGFMSMYGKTNTVL